MPPNVPEAGEDHEKHAGTNLGLSVISKEETGVGFLAASANSLRLSADGEGRLICRLAFLKNVAMVDDMEGNMVLTSATSDRSHLPSHVPHGADLLALKLSDEARGISGLDVLRRSVDRAPPAQS